jgi:hypothetical protein
MTEELFIGIARAPAGQIAHAVVLDESGRPVHQCWLAWTPEKLRHLLATFISKAPTGILLGLLNEDLDDPIKNIVRQSALPTKLIDRSVLDRLYACLSRRKQTVALRARSIAQILWLSEYRPTDLNEVR